MSSHGRQMGMHMAGEVVVLVVVVLEGELRNDELLRPTYGALGSKQTPAAAPAGPACGYSALNVQRGHQPMRPDESVTRAHCVPDTKATATLPTATLPTATLAHSYIQQREAFAFLVPKNVVKQRRRWRQQERDKAMRNVFEAQMHARMRRQSLKQAEIREAKGVEADCVTLDLGSARSTVSSQPTGKIDHPRQWVPHSIEEEISSSESESSLLLLRDDERPDNDLVLRVPQPLTHEAKFRLETLGGLDMALAVPTFVYKVFLAEDGNKQSGVATEGSTGMYRAPRLLHNSRVNLPPRPAHCYV